LIRKEEKDDHEECLAELEVNPRLGVKMIGDSCRARIRKPRAYHLPPMLLNIALFLSLDNAK